MDRVVDECRDSNDIRMLLDVESWLPDGSGRLYQTTDLWTCGSRRLFSSVHPCGGGGLHLPDRRSRGGLAPEFERPEFARRRTGDAGGVVGLRSGCRSRRARESIYAPYTPPGSSGLPGDRARTGAVLEPRLAEA